MPGLTLSMITARNDDAIARSGGWEWLIIMAIAAGPSLLALVDIVRLPRKAWRRSGQSPAICTALVVLGCSLGALIYLVGPRIQLARAVKAMRAEKLAAEPAG
jgi:hypothetical protein